MLRQRLLVLAGTLLMHPELGAQETAYLAPTRSKVLVEGAIDRASWKIDGVVAIRHPHWAPQYTVIEFDDKRSAEAGLEAFRNVPSVRNARFLRNAPREPRAFELNDPLATFDAAQPGYQWHLMNTGQNNAVTGIDLNVAAAWNTFRGSGIAVAILDDAVQVSHPDIAPNASNSLHFDWLDETSSDPEGTSLEEHGTACAGLAAGRGGNGMGISGVAPEASLVGLRMLGNLIDDEVEGAALAHEADAIQIKSSSWGPSDRNTATDGPAELAAAALQHGARTGRNGLGTLYVWAAGNGRADGDLANHDGYSNSIYTIAIGAVTDSGSITDYGELGANVLISAPSSGGQQEVTTTDLMGFSGKNSGLSAQNYANGDYRNGFGGTSAAAPQIAGALALMLEANPALSWRDVQEILLRSGRRVQADDAGWLENAGGFQFHPALGAGLLDVSSAVELATDWQPLPPQTIAASAQVQLYRQIPDGDVAGIALPVSFSEETANLRVEHVTVHVRVSHEAKSQLRINLVSPSGTVSPLAMPHIPKGSDPNQDFDWTFMTVFHWGEPLAGEWQLVLADETVGVSGTLDSFSVVAYGSLPSDAPDSYSDWAAVHFQNGQMNEPSADPDADGQSNLLEYAQGTDPLTIEQPAAAPFEYRRNPNALDLQWLLEYSASLQDWIPAGSTLVRTEVDTTEIYQATPPDGSSGDGYFRLRVVLSENP